MQGRVQLDAVIFDLGGVVLGWEPERAFEQVMPAEEVAGFLERIDFEDWNRRNDGGRPFEEAEAELIARFPTPRAACTATGSTSIHAERDGARHGGGDRRARSGRCRPFCAHELVRRDVPDRP